MNTLKKKFGSILCFGLFVCLVAFMGGQFNVAKAEKGGPCPKRRVDYKFWCDFCKEVTMNKECVNLPYKENTEDEATDPEFLKHKTTRTWACMRNSYHCINPECENSKACYAFNIGFCEVCNDDLTGPQDWSKVDFKCPKCSKVIDSPGVGAETHFEHDPIDESISGGTLHKIGNCKDCGVQLESVCKKSGTCPHEPDF